ncbi:uncharacterized protein LOC109504398 [Harpegnathos saltator]|uniref:uncharacterized protein LOC109504398 n=1 Tax=Harpegnathos saltator TaxID=610380 RepID=UPI000DBEDDA4|nr:uncharacterized protein LOC109504398 [Harpegnathos saltator]
MGSVERLLRGRCGGPAVQDRDPMARFISGMPSGVSTRNDLTELVATRWMLRMRMLCTGGSGSGQAGSARRSVTENEADLEFRYFDLTEPRSVCGGCGGRGEMRFWWMRMLRYRRIRFGPSRVGSKICGRTWPRSRSSCHFGTRINQSKHLV